MPRLPTHRVGPYPEDELPPWSVPLRRAMPSFGHPGGGWEAATDDAAYVFGVVALGGGVKDVKSSIGRNGSW
jgi:hypothetical protein